MPTKIKKIVCKKRYPLYKIDSSVIEVGQRIRTSFDMEAYWSEDDDSTGEYLGNREEHEHKTWVEGVITSLDRMPDGTIDDFTIGSSTRGRRDGIENDGTTFSDGANDEEGNWCIHTRRETPACWIEFISMNKNRAKTITMNDVIIDDSRKDMVRAAVSQVENNQLIFEDWGFDEVFEKGTAVALLFWGPPGTGKTMMCQAIANELGLNLKVIQSGEIWSSEPGAAERTIKEYFQTAPKNKWLLLFDECDSLIADRNEVGMILGAQINALLSSLENYTGVVGFTTNRLGTMDPAFERRVSVKVEFPFPDQPQRLKIWKQLIPKKAPIANDVDFIELSHVPIAGGNIKNVVLNAARIAAFKKKRAIDRECFETALEKEGEAIKSFEANINSKPHYVGTYGFSQHVKADVEGIDNVISSLRDKRKNDYDIISKIVDDSIDKKEVVAEKKPRARRATPKKEMK